MPCIIKFFLTALLLFAGTYVTYARNILYSPYANMEAPQGTAYNKVLSDEMGLDVFLTADNESLIAIGTEDVNPDVSLPEFASALAITMGDKSDDTANRNVIKLNLKNDDGTSNGTAYVVSNNKGDRTFAVAKSRHAQQNIVIIILGKISPESARDYIKTLHINK